MPFAKLLWVKENLPDVFEKTQKILISSKDYILYQLTGAAVSDVVASSTAGLMDIRKKQWNTQWLDAFNLASGLLPRLCSPEEKIGTILDSALLSAFCVRTRLSMPDPGMRERQRLPAVFPKTGSLISIWGLQAGLPVFQISR
jgi:xylulokinase